MMHGIGTHRGVQVATSSRIAHRAVADRVQANQSVDRVKQTSVENRVADKAQAQRQVNIAA